jgi:hypothetical protein
MRVREWWVYGFEIPWDTKWRSFPTTFLYKRDQINTLQLRMIRLILIKFYTAKVYTSRLLWPNIINYSWSIQWTFIFKSHNLKAFPTKVTECSVKFQRPSQLMQESCRNGWSLTQPWMREWKEVSGQGDRYEVKTVPYHKNLISCFSSP